MATQTYDIITVGGGLGGAALVKVMAEREARVLMLDTATQFTDRVRGDRYYGVLHTYEAWQTHMVLDHRS
jgi:choline dehydrogenase-like flavoprotein